MPPKDHWTSSAYQSSAAFVPLLTTRLLSLLPSHPTSLLDIGSGDGALTRRLAPLLSPAPTARLLALDSSPAMVAAASAASASDDPRVTYARHDCAVLGAHPAVVPGAFDVLFSNAALHWILRAEGARRRFFADCFVALRRGGALVFEMGGAGNVAEVRAAVAAVLHAEGVTAERLGEVQPWFFPDEGWMRAVLEGEGFVVEVLETEYRPTKLGEGAVEGWVRLMCAGYLEAVEEERRDMVVRKVVEAVDGVVTREDGSKWLGYVRLRCRARKPEDA